MRSSLTGLCYSFFLVFGILFYTSCTSTPCESYCEKIYQCATSWLEESRDLSDCTWTQKRKAFVDQCTKNCENEAESIDKDRFIGDSVECLECMLNKIGETCKPHIDIVGPKCNSSGSCEADGGDIWRMVLWSEEKEQNISCQDEQFYYKCMTSYTDSSYCNGY